MVRPQVNKQDGGGGSNRYASLKQDKHTAWHLFILSQGSSQQKPAVCKLSGFSPVKSLLKYLPNSTNLSPLLFWDRISWCSPGWLHLSSDLSLLSAACRPVPPILPTTEMQFSPCITIRTIIPWRYDCYTWGGCFMYLAFFFPFSKLYSLCCSPLKS
jgi:hypothetical protein